MLLSDQPPKLPWKIVINNILTRLPVKTLVRFKCVSKSWKTLISKPQFAKKHLLQTKSSSSFDSELPQNVVLVDPHKNHKSFFVNVDDYSIEELPFDPFCRHPRQWWDYYGKCDLYLFDHSCDGLLIVCCPTDGFIVVWNPSIRAGKRVSYDRNQHTPAGLCYNSVSDDYKIVSIHPVYGKEINRKIPRCYKLSVCSLKTEAWKDLAEIHNYLFEEIPIRNVALHWFVKYRHGNHDLRIVYFDPMKEKIKEVPMMPLPKDLEKEHEFGRLVMTALRGSIFLSFYSTESRAIEVWKMKEDDGSWVRMTSIQCNPFRAHPNCFPKLLYFTKDGEKFICSNNYWCNLFIYSRGKNKWELLLSMKDHCDYDAPQVLTYTKTLVLPRKENNMVLGRDVDSTDKEEEEKQQTLILNSVCRKESRRIKRWKDNKTQKRKMRILELFLISRSTKNSRREIKVKGRKKDRERAIEEAISEGSDKRTVEISSIEEDDQCEYDRNFDAPQILTYTKTLVLPRKENNLVLGRDVDSTNKEEEEEKEQTLILNSVCRKESRRIKRWKDNKAQKRKMRILELLLTSRSTKSSRREIKLKGRKKDRERAVEEAISEGSNKGTVEISSIEEEEEEEEEFKENT